MNVSDYQSGMFSLVGLLTHVPSKRKYDFNHHEKFNYQGVNYFIHSPYELFSKSSVTHQTIANHSMIVYLNPQKRVIDEALESYEPKG
jgi:hypothetical protein